MQPQYGDFQLSPFPPVNMVLLCCLPIGKCGPSVGTPNWGDFLTIEVAIWDLVV